MVLQQHTVRGYYQIVFYDILQIYRYIVYCAVGMGDTVYRVQ